MKTKVGVIVTKIEEKIEDFLTRHLTLPAAP
jgi:hypothetical protein